MIKKIYVTPPLGSPLELDMRTSGADEGLIIFNLEGLGPPKATVSGTGGPNFDGVRASFVKVDARHMILTIAVSAKGDAEEVSKQKIYTYFPIKQEITFRVETDAKDVYITAIVESVEMNSFAKVENAVISLYCPDPYFLDMIEETDPIDKDGTLVQNLAEVPTGMDIIIDIIGTFSSDITLGNTNQWQELTIDITPISQAVGLPMVPNDQIVINTRSGEKSVWFWDDSTSTWHNIFNAMGINDDWIQLFLASNYFTWSCATPSYEDDMTLEIKYRLLYEGV